MAFGQELLVGVTGVVSTLSDSAAETASSQALLKYEEIMRFSRSLQPQTKFALGRMTVVAKSDDTIMLITYGSGLVQAMEMIAGGGRDAVRKAENLLSFGSLVKHGATRKDGTPREGYTKVLTKRKAICCSKELVGWFCRRECNFKYHFNGDGFLVPTHDACPSLRASPTSESAVPLT